MAVIIKHTEPKVEQAHAFDDSHKAYFDIGISDYLEVGKNKESNCMFSRLTPFRNGVRNLREFFTKEGYLGTPITARTCPGINKYMERTTRILMPSDTYIAYNDQNIESLNVINMSAFGVEHPAYQTELPNGTNILDDKTINIKIKFPFLINPSKPLLLLDPIYHTGQNRDWKVVPGILDSGIPTFLNIIMQIPAPEENARIITIKKGTVLAYLYHPEKPTLKQVKELRTLPKYKLFGGFVK